MPFLEPMYTGSYPSVDEPGNQKFIEHDMPDSASAGEDRFFSFIFSIAASENILC